MSVENGRANAPGGQANSDDFYRRLYDDKAEYVARRDDTSLEARFIRLEVEAFKVPKLIAAWIRLFERGRNRVCDRRTAGGLSGTSRGAQSGI